MMRRVDSMPLMPGMLMSMSTRSGSRVATRSTASSPLAASPVSSKPGVMRTTDLAAARKGIWSSTTTTETTRSATALMVTSGGGSSHSARTTGLGGLVLRAAIGQEEQDGLHPAVHLSLLGQAELGEDGVDVLLHRPFGEHQRLGDGGVRPAPGHLRQDLRLSGRQLPQR